MQLHQIFSWLFLLFVVVWLLFVRLLFKEIEVKFPKKYEEMGRPKLPGRTGVRAGLQLIKVIFGPNEWASDAKLEKIITILRVLFLAGGVITSMQIFF